MIKTTEEKLYEIYNETYVDISKYIISKVDNLSEVEDILQEVYLNFYKVMDKKDIENPRKYLFTIARNEIFKTYGLLKVMKFNIPIFSLEEKNIDSNNNETLMLKENVDDKLFYQEILEYLEGKDKIAFKIFELYFRYDLKIKEIAEILNLNESTIKNKLYRNMKRLKKIFQFQEV